jgi:hypothetical protein
MKTLVIFLIYAMLYALCTMPVTKDCKCNGTDGRTSVSTWKLPLTKDCKCNHIPLQGKVRIVTSEEDFRVRITDIDPDIRIRITPQPIRCGEWDTVSCLEDFRIKIVNFDEDFSIQFSDLPGLSTRLLNQ